MNDTVSKEDIVLTGLKNIPFDGFTLHVFVEAARAQKIDAPELYVQALFPGGLSSIIDYFVGWTNQEMLKQLGDVGDGEPVRARIERAVMTRFHILNPYKQALRSVAAHNIVSGGPHLWRSADVIWVWAGDTATDYNHYTKRTLLCGVMISSALAWLADDSEDLNKTQKFVQRRIENVLKIGQFIGRFKKTGS